MHTLCGVVRRSLIDKDAGLYYSCGSHLLEERDVEIASDLELDAALDWMVLLGLHLVADRPDKPVRDGDGFRLNDGGPRRIMHFAECTRYEPGDFFYNPYGYIRWMLTCRPAPLGVYDSLWRPGVRS